MNLGHLRDFLTLAGTMNFTKTAGAINITQSALSKRISALETELGAKLLIRTNRTIELTPAGKYLFQNGAKLLSVAEDIQNHIRGMSRDSGGSLHIATITIDMPAFFNTVAWIKKQYPEADVNIWHDLIYMTVRKVCDGQADFGITSNYVIEHDMDSGCLNIYDDMNMLLLKKEPLYLLVSDSDPLAGRESISLGELPAGTPILIEKILKAYVDERMGTSDLVSRLKVTKVMNRDYQAWETTILQVKSGFYTALVPRPLSHDGCFCIAVSDEKLSYDILILWRKDLQNPIAESFIRHLRYELPKPGDRAV